MSVNSVTEYLENLNEDGKEHVRDFLTFMNREYPDLVLKICFSMPMWFLGQKMKDGYIGISAAKKHVSIHFSDENFVDQLAERLVSCKRGKRCINIPYGDEKSFQLAKDSIKNFLR